jgi:hypothetical protein
VSEDVPRARPLFTSPWRGEVAARSALFPSPLWGGVRGGGGRVCSRFSITPLSVPPPQGGRERCGTAGVQIARHGGDIAPQDRRQIRIHHRGIAAPDQLDQRRHFVADRHLRETHRARQRRHLALVLGKPVGVHEHDRHRRDAVRLGRFQIAPHRREIGCALHHAVGAHALVHFGDALVQHVGLDDVAGENLRPRLIADLERVAETFCNEQQRALALAFEQRIRSHRRAHLHRVDAAGRDRLAGFEAQQITDALHGGVGIGFRIFRQQLVRHQRAVRPPPHHVGEGAAAVDPEIPKLR